MICRPPHPACALAARCSRRETGRLRLLGERFVPVMMASLGVRHRRRLFPLSEHVLEEPRRAAFPDPIWRKFVIPRRRHVFWPAINQRVFSSRRVLTRRMPAAMRPSPSFSDSNRPARSAALELFQLLNRS